VGSSSDFRGRRSEAELKDLLSHGRKSRFFVALGMTPSLRYDTPIPQNDAMIVRGAALRCGPYIPRGCASKAAVIASTQGESTPSRPGNPLSSSAYERSA